MLLNTCLIITFAASVLGKVSVSDTHFSNSSTAFCHTIKLLKSCIFLTSFHSSLYLSLRRRRAVAILYSSSLSFSPHTGDSQWWDLSTVTILYSSSLSFSQKSGLQSRQSRRHNICRNPLFIKS